MALDDLQPPKPGEWVEYSDDRRRLLLYGGPLTEPVATLAGAGWEQFEVVSTERALADSADLVGVALRVHLVPGGRVDELAAGLAGAVGSDRVVALGGGRVIDTAKAVASVTGAEVAAIPTTLSGAPMTGFHRLPAGRESEVTGFVRPSPVLAYADAMTDADEQQLRATAMNALAHGADSLYTPRADSESRGTALRGAELIAGALEEPRESRDRAALALGAMLCAIAVDRAGFTLHHVLGQTAVRVLEIPHADAYAALLPHTTEAMRGRAPEQVEALARALGTKPDEIGERISELAGDRHLGELGADRGRIDDVIEGALARPELASMTPGEVNRSDLAEILDAAW